MTVPMGSVASVRAALKEVEPLAASLNMFSTEFDGSYELPTVAARRRRLRASESDPVSTCSLVLNDEGVLLWREGAPDAQPSGRKLRRGLSRPTEGELIELYQFEKLEPNEINQFLMTLDAKLNSSPGLWKLEKLEPTAIGEQVRRSAATVTPTGKKRRLVLVHGTFSQSDAFLYGINRAPNGQSFIRRLFAHYDEVLVFDHPTLSVSPLLNAFDLGQAMSAATGPLDIVAHSRGGLVTRWFMEAFAGGAKKGPYCAVLVGSPLGGTSLASPPRLRSSLSMLSNIGTALKLGGAPAVLYFPLLAAPLALLKIATSVVSAAAKTPLIDAAVSMIPGLGGQSRVDLNQELTRVRGLSVANPPAYFVVQSNFETENPGWKFWKWFRGDRIKDVVTDKVFPGSNDLVVDTRSMSEFSIQPGGQGLLEASDVLDFETTDKVHHTNYFEQEETLDFILTSLGVP